MAAAKKTSKSSKASAARQTGGSSRSSSHTTTNHGEIRKWAEQRQGVPSCVRGTGDRGDVGVLRIDFPGGEEEKFQELSWDQWFSKFDERNLAFLYQDKTAGGKISRFNKIVSRETAAGQSGRTRKSAGAKTRKAGG